jgi:hypothetical protein
LLAIRRKPDLIIYTNTDLNPELTPAPFSGHSETTCSDTYKGIRLVLNQSMPG